ncbi:unnamed protein product [Ambrosiozyma monospora]|uniref:Unnamed protein product n=1 Tax=Ambrosiozyma monospora TaxID=43982 RepID=A0ACB5TQM8_AMBMO|nr:unnamed protein product [Ambrosiozyma monospora]
MYSKGLTPNPDVGCNKFVKFGSMIKHLESYYASDGGKQKLDKGQRWWLVTGHYARVLQNEQNGQYQLFRSTYLPKDQSYYLSMVPEKVLSKVLMPVGHYTKPEIRKIAQHYNLITKDKKDSQGLCFVSQVGKFKDFLAEYLPSQPGDIVTKDGKVWGHHTGLWNATIGQKSGVSMPQGDPKYHGVWFVSEKRIEKNQLVISKFDDVDAFVKDLIYVDEWTWLNEDLSLDKIKDGVSNGDFVGQYRSLQDPPLELKDLGYVDVNNEGKLVFKLAELIKGIAPGQYFVLYNRLGRVMGSGIIVDTKNSTLPDES